MSNQKLYQQLSKSGGVLNFRGGISSSKYQWGKPWFGVPIFWETPGYMNPWVAGRLLHLAGDTRHLHETAQLQGKEQRLLPGVAGSLWGKFFENDRTENLVQKTVVN